MTRTATSQHPALRIQTITTRAVPIHCPSSEETSTRQPMDWIGAHICDLWPAFRAAVIADNGQGNA